MLNYPEKSQINGKLFEYQCVYTLQLILWKNISPEFLITYGLGNNDIGVDLIDINNKILYQCKHFTKTYCGEHNVKTFNNIYKHFHDIDEEWIQILLVSEKTKITKGLLNNMNIKTINFNKQLIEK